MRANFTHRRQGNSTRRCCALFLAIILPMALPATPARADLFGGDIAVLAQILLQTIEEVNQLKQTYETTKNNLDLVKQTLETDPRNFGDVLNIINTARGTYDSFRSDSQQVGFRIETVKANFHRLFPKSRDLSKVKYSDYDAMYGSWQDELRASAEAASHAQANTAQLEAQLRAAKAAVAASGGADGEVRQLQAIVQMLGVMQSQITTLITTISTAERVNSTLVASSADEKMMNREARRRRRENYTSRGKTVSVPPRSP
jgi:P-type conjugative transfer protein TrbJ